MSDVLLLNATVEDEATAAAANGVLDEEQRHAANTNGSSEPATENANQINNEDQASAAAAGADEEGVSIVTASPFLDQSLLNDMRLLFKNTRYFLLKSNNYENVRLAKRLNVWATPKINEIKLNKAFRECANVMLIFSVSESGRFSGFARLAAPSDYNIKMHVNWVLPPMLNHKSLSGLFKIDWITKADLVFQKTNHLHNPWNEMRAVKIGRDGQEFEPECGEQLCRLFDLFERGSDTPDEFVMGIGLQHLSTSDVRANLTHIIEKSKKRHADLMRQCANLTKTTRRSSRSRTRGSRSRSRSRSGAASRSSRSTSRGSVEAAVAAAIASDIKPTQALVLLPEDFDDHGGGGGGRKRNGDYHRSSNTNNSDYRRRNHYQDDHRYNYNNNRQQHQQQQYSNQSVYQPPNAAVNAYQMNAASAFPSYATAAAYNVYNTMAFQQQQQQHIINNSIAAAHQADLLMAAAAASSMSAAPALASGGTSSTERTDDKSDKKGSLSKDLILKSTYEEYLAAFMGTSSNPNSAYPNPTGYDYNPYSQAYPPYTNGYGIPPGYPNSKYEQDVEAFLRRTAFPTGEATSGNNEDGRDRRRYHSPSPAGSSESSSSHHNNRNRNHTNNTHRSSKHYDERDRDRDRDRDRERDRDRDRNRDEDYHRHYEYKQKSSGSGSSRHHRSYRSRSRSNSSKRKSKSSNDRK